MENAALDFTNTKADPDTKAGPDTKADPDTNANSDTKADPDSDTNADTNVDNATATYSGLDQVSKNCRGTKGKHEALDVKADRLEKPVNERSTT
jgi:hypothetical protein